MSEVTKEENVAIGAYQAALDMVTKSNDTQLQVDVLLELLRLLHKSGSLVLDVNALKAYFINHKWLHKTAFAELLFSIRLPVICVATFLYLVANYFLYKLTAAMIQA